MAEVELEKERCAARAQSDDYVSPPFSIDHERGFEDGFVDYLVYGGTGNPPPLPPRRYWWSDCGGVNGCNAIQEWFKGFEHGAAVAKASGCRQCVTVPLSDSLLIDNLPIYPSHWSERIEPAALDPEVDPLQEQNTPVNRDENLNDIDAPSPAQGDGNIQWIGPGARTPVDRLPESTTPLSDSNPSSPSDIDFPLPAVIELQAAFAIQESAIPIPSAKKTTAPRRMQLPIIRTELDMAPTRELVPAR
ncbi:MAG: hypothetical protein KDB00_25610 [Planctomycetales bacterium]|nr:hypothetical protein [Planctomycetales bacterium]